MNLFASSEQRATVYLRVGLVAVGCLLLQSIFSFTFAAPFTQQPLYMLLIVAFGGVGLSLIACAGLRQPPSWLVWAIPLVIIFRLVFAAVIWIDNTRSDKQWFLSQRSGIESIDNGLMTQLAGQLVINGYNPYTWDVSGIYDIYRASQFASSPQLNGSDGKAYPYPAFIFLVNVPLQVLGLPGSFLISCASYLGLMGLLFMAASAEIRPLILLPFFLTDTFQISSFAGNQDIVWTLLMVAMVLCWRRRWPRSLLYGLAVASKQPPWLLAPFLAIKIWREEGWREVIRFFVVTGAVFAGVNAPFIFMDARAWFVGTFQPLLDQMIFISSYGGLSEINQSGYSFLPRNYYTLLTLAVFGLLIFIYWRHYRSLRRTLYWMPALVMWFSYRSLTSYWYYWLFPAVAALLVTEISLPKLRAANWRLTAGLVGVVAAFLTIIGVVLSTYHPIQVAVAPRFIINEWGRVGELTVEVTNHSDRVMTPRFQFKVEQTGMMPWTINDGPATVPAGGTGTYHIYSDRSERSFFNFQFATLFVTDAGGDYGLTGVYTLPPDKSSFWPDSIANPTYRYWLQDGSAPVFWYASPETVGRISYAQFQGRDTLILNPSGKLMDLQQLSAFPYDRFGMWVYVDSAAPTEVGVMLEDGTHRLTYQMGQAASHNDLDGVIYTIYQHVESDQWVYVEFDPLADYQAVNWELPPYQYLPHRGQLDIDLRFVNVRVFAIGTQPGYISEIVQPQRQVSAEHLIDEALANPGEYYIRLAAQHERERNVSAALDAYRAALAALPDNPFIQEQIQRLCADQSSC